jgi:hypothetical protein
MSVGIEWEVAEMSLEQKNASLRQAVQERLGGCCEGDRMCHVEPEHPVLADPEDESDDVADPVHEFRGGWTAEQVLEKFAPLHPSSAAFQAALGEVWLMHRTKSRDYGSASDPLANIRNGAEFVGIEPWRAAMVRLSDKVTRLATFNRTGELHHEAVEDSLLDLASYALLTLVLRRQDAADD